MWARLSSFLGYGDHDDDNEKNGNYEDDVDDEDDYKDDNKENGNDNVGQVVLLPGL